MKINHFESLTALGYKSIIPIVPYDAKLSESSKIGLPHRGKVPGQLNRNGLWTGFPEWQNHEVTPKDIKNWSNWHGAGVGIRCGEIIAFDIDVLSEKESYALGKHVQEKLGKSYIRVGLKPKFIMIYRSADLLAKRRITFTLPDDINTHAIELLGKGQQFVAHGVHSKTGRPYTWYDHNNEPCSTLPRYAELIEITANQIDKIWKSIHKIIIELGGKIISTTKNSNSVSRKPIGHPTTKGDPELIIKALDSLPNDFDYDDWIRMCAALKAAFGGKKEYYFAFEAWCMKYEGDNTPEQIRSIWDSIKDTELGADYVIDAARQAGFNTAVYEFEVSNSDITPIDTMFERYVWVEEFKSFFDTHTCQLLDEKQFNTRLADVGNPINRNKCASTIFVNDLKRRKTVRSLTYQPGKELFLENNKFLNTWQSSNLNLPECVTDEDVGPWLELINHVIPDKNAQEIILNWCAYILLHLSEKCNWAVLLGSSAQGIGKDMMFQPIIEGLGRHNVKYIGPADLSGGYTDWAAKSKLVIIEEMHSFERKEMMNKLKGYITAPPNEVRINVKYIPHYQVPNIGAYLFFSNLPNALAIEKEDRRFYVYWSPAKPDENGLYSRVDNWYNTGGIAKAVRWLMQRDLLLFDAKGRAPDSESKREMRRSSQGALEYWVETCIEEQTQPFDTDLISADDIMHRLPNHIRCFRPTLQSLVHAIKSNGAVSTKTQMRLGKKLPTTQSDRVRLLIIRNAERYLQMDLASLRKTFLDQYEKSNYEHLL